MHNENKSRQTQTSSTSVSNLNVQDTAGITVAGSDHVSIVTTDANLAAAAESIARESLSTASFALQDSNNLARDMVDASGVIVTDSLDFARDLSTSFADNTRDLTSDALGMGERLIGKFGDFTSGLFQDAFEAVTGVVTESQAQLGNTVSNLNAIARQQSTSSDERVQSIAEKAMIAGAVMVGLVVVSMMFSRMSK